MTGMNGIQRIDGNIIRINRMDTRYFIDDTNINSDIINENTIIKYYK